MTILITRIDEYIDFLHEVCIFVTLNETQDKAKIKINERVG